jgi:hypothetical protein
MEVARVLVRLVGAPGVNGFALNAEGLLNAAVDDGDHGSVQDHLSQPFGGGTVESFGWIRCLSGETLDYSVDLDGRDGRGRVREVLLASEPAQHHERFLEQESRPGCLSDAQSWRSSCREAGDVC